MALPKLDTPLYNITLPVSQKKISFRAFKVKEEKVLLTGKEGSTKDQLAAMRQLLINCVETPKDFDPDVLSMPDIEYLFIQLRARSVQNIVELKYRDKEDNKVYDFEVDLDDIKPTIDSDRQNKIELNKTIGIELMDPTLGVLSEIDITDMDNSDNAYAVIAACTKQVWDADEVYDDFTKDELIEFLQSMDIKMFTKMKEFFETSPKITHELKYKNAEGNDRSIKLEGISDFF
jgi:hypothetical protein